MSFLSDKKLFVFDMDGTVYLGDIVFENAVKFIKKLRAEGKKVLFFTNNASHNASFYISKLNRMGFDATEDELMSSGDVTAEFLIRHRKGKSVYLLGTPELYDLFKAKGVSLTDGDSADITVTSFDTTLTYEKLTKACTQIRNGSEFLCTHPDFNCPTETGFIPDSGAIVACITASTGKSPVYFGKPYSSVIEMICEYTGSNKSEIVVFGDRLYTDIALGKKNGVSSVLVLTGEATLEDVEKAQESERPDYIYPSLGEVYAEMFGNLK